MRPILEEDTIVAFKFPNKNCMCFGALREDFGESIEVVLLHDFGVFKKGTVARFPYKEVYALTKNNYKEMVEKKIKSRDTHISSLSNMGKSAEDLEKFKREYVSADKLEELGFKFYDPFTYDIRYAGLFE